MSGLTALDMALMEKRDAAAIELIVGGADIKDEIRWSTQDALILAVTEKRTDAVRILRESGANPWTQDEGGISPRMLAKLNNAQEVFEVLNEFHDPEVFSTRRDKQAGGCLPPHSFSGRDAERGALFSAHEYFRSSIVALAAQKRNLPF